jgi:hypothetical protein
MIAGDRDGELEPDEVAELALLADLLADPSTWSEPSPGLEDAIVHAVAEAEPAAPTSTTGIITGAPGRRAHRRQRVLVSAIGAAAAAAAIIVGVVLVTHANTGPEYQAQLSATGLAPGAHASADITNNNAGFRITLKARGLPPLTGGEYYQAWLKNAAGSLVPVGTFSSSDGTVTLWSGVSPKAFPTITVTIEAPDNDQTSSGRRVLVGRIVAH